MTVEMRRILKSKQEYRQRLAELPIADKLRSLEELRQRSLTLAASRAKLAAELATRKRESERGMKELEGMVR